VWIVTLALRRPYTFVVVVLLIVLLGAVAMVRTPTDIFPEVNIPVVSVIWSLTGLPVNDMKARVITTTERAFTTSVNDIEAHRVPVDAGRGRDQGVLPPEHADRRRGRAGHGRLPDAAAHDAAGHHAAPDPPVQRVQRSDPEFLGDWRTSPGRRRDLQRQ